LNGDGAWTPLTGKSIQESESAIERTVGLPYEVLISGPFSLQGDSARFTHAPVSDRIAVLSDLLGLSVYQEWREAAGREARSLDQHAQMLEARAVAAATALETQDEIKQRKIDAVVQLHDVRLSLESLTKDRQETERKLATLESAIPQARKTLAAFATDKATLASRQKSRNEKQEKADRLTQILSRSAEIESKAAQATETTRVLADTRQELTILDQDISKARAERDRLVTVNLAAQKANAAILQEEQRITIEAKGLDPLIAGHQKRAAVKDTVPCTRFLRWPTGEGDEYVSLSAECPLLKDALESDAQVGALCNKRDQLKAWKRPHLQPEIPTEDVDRRLRLLGVEVASCRLKVDQGEQALQDLAKWTALLPELSHAEADLPGISGEIQDHDVAISILVESLAEEPKLAAAIREDEAKIIALQSELSRQSKSLSANQQAERAAVQAIATADAQLAVLEKLAEEGAAAQGEAARIRSRHTLMVALEQFYRQAPLMILENEAIPAIEHEANSLLARISPNGMRLQLRTQREIRSRDTLADGLDIIITDQVGEREYEAYSGGQQFQIDLAIRVALAKLQARKAGASIESLVIDEGWGTQSVECLDGIIAALRSIQSEFKLLWVISHVEGLKDVFESRIDVAGGPQDSTAVLVG
jgi:exonuclease SbcC